MQLGNVQRKKVIQLTILESEIKNSMMLVFIKAFLAMSNHGRWHHGKGTSETDHMARQEIRELRFFVTTYSPGDYLEVRSYEE